MDINMIEKRNSATLERAIARSRWLTPKFMSDRDRAELEKIRDAQRGFDRAMVEGASSPLRHRIDSAWMNAALGNLVAKVESRYVTWVLRTRFPRSGAEKVQSKSIARTKGMKNAEMLLERVNERITQGESSDELLAQERWFRWAGIALRAQAVANVLRMRLVKMIRAERARVATASTLWGTSVPVVISDGGDSHDLWPASGGMGLIHENNDLKNGQLDNGLLDHFGSDLMDAAGDVSLPTPLGIDFMGSTSPELFTGDIASSLFSGVDHFDTFGT